MNNGYVLCYDIYTALGKTLLDKMENSSSYEEAEILLNCLGEANKSVQATSILFYEDPSKVEEDSQIQDLEG